MNLVSAVVLEQIPHADERMTLCITRIVIMLKLSNGV